MSGVSVIIIIKESLVGVAPQDDLSHDPAHQDHHQQSRGEEGK